MRKKPKNLIANFRLRTQAHKEIWESYKQYCWDHGLDLCQTTISQIQAFMNAQGKIESPGQIINQQIQNNFYYQVQKSRREPIMMSCAKPAYQRTTTTAAWEAYVMEKARGMNHSFCFRDFAELEHNSFRKIILRLKKKRKVVAIPERTCPRFYVLSERLDEDSIDMKMCMRTTE